MFKKSLSLGLACLLTITLAGLQSAYAGAKSEKQSKHAAKVKAGIIDLGTGEDARVAVRLKDKKRLSGFVSEAREDSFLTLPVAKARGFLGHKATTLALAKGPHSESNDETITR